MGVDIGLLITIIFTNESLFIKTSFVYKFSSIGLLHLAFKLPFRYGTLLKFGFFGLIEASGIIGKMFNERLSSIYWVFTKGVFYLKG